MAKHCIAKHTQYQRFDSNKSFSCDINIFKILTNWPYQCELVSPFQWRHNECDGISNHQPHDCLLNRLFRRRLKKTPKFRVTGLCEGNSPMTGEFPAQMASNAQFFFIWWRHHVTCLKYVRQDNYFIHLTPQRDIQGSVTQSLTLLHIPMLFPKCAAIPVVSWNRLSTDWVGSMDFVTKVTIIWISFVMIGIQHTKDLRDQWLQSSTTVGS